ncbi:MAG: LPXTG cell wall anchor domain-containing protein [Aestuariibaculum sp.]
MKYLNYILILVGAIVALYSNTGEKQNQYVLIIGIVLLMVGIYRISKTIPSKYADKETNETNNED